MSRWNKHVSELPIKISESGLNSIPWITSLHHDGMSNQIVPTFLYRSDRCDGFSGADLGKLVLRAANYRFREFFRLRKKAGDADGSGAAGSVSQRHFDLAFEAVKPSVGEADRKKYEAMKKRYTSSATR